MSPAASPKCGRCGLGATAGTEAFPHVGGPLATNGTNSSAATVKLPGVPADH
jgi:hypothetical protein